MNNESEAPQESPEGQPDSAIMQRTVHIPFPENFAYANCCAFAIGQMEIRLGFAEAIQTGKAISKVGVVMPPEAAAVLALVLLQQVHIYEANFGEIRHPAWKAMKAGQPFDEIRKNILLKGNAGIPPEESPAEELPEK
ncbi:MAG: DUF3467 domain-containing protein [Acidobacteriia bacterium]|nr:DUF3467 domain-containing protein [Terriglobia bacterium]